MQNQANVMPHQMLTVGSVPIFILGTSETGLDKVSNIFQGLKSTDSNFQGLIRP